MLSTKCRPLGIVGHQLCLGQALLVDLGVDDEHWDASIDRLAHRTDRTVRIGGIENDRLGLIGDRRIDLVAFGIGIPLVGADVGFVTELLGGGFGDLASVNQ